MLATLKNTLRENFPAALARPVEAIAHEQLRLRLLFAIAIMKLLNFIGGAWDIQWHVEIGRDSLFIPPHLMVFAAFLGGLLVALGLVAYETAQASMGHPPTHTARLGPLYAPHAFFGVLIGYLLALLSAVFDELWHEIFGIDATLWSPPHLLIMASTMFVDFSLMLGITISARRLGYTFTWRSPLLWGLVLTGAYAFEAVNFQMGEAFIVGYRGGGAGLLGLLFPLLVGAFLPFSMMILVRLARRFWVVLLAIGMSLGLQYVSTGVAALGFAILKPVSVIEAYVLENPQSTAAMAREFARLLGFDGLIGFHQAWTMSLMVLPLVLVALLEAVPWARRRPLVAAPVFSTAMVLGSYVWFSQTPPLNGYVITALDVALATAISAGVGLATGWLGMWLAQRGTSAGSPKELVSDN